jgi:RimJ/RimL family protein N-acetyltransferase
MTLRGRTVTVAPLRPDDAPALFAAFRGADEMWDYMPIGPFAREADLADWIAQVEGSIDPLFFSFSPEGEGAAGFGSYLRVTPAAGSIEVGYLSFSPRLQRSVAATEAMYLMMKWAFGAGYRRYEWKCNALNAASRRAAERLGLSYEGVFRQAAVVKGRNRDTAWFAAIDAEWPALEAAFQTWLSPENFDDAGRQKNALSALTAPILVVTDPARS